MKKIIHLLAVTVLTASLTGIPVHKEYTANFAFHDDDNGNWTIDTSDHSYHFEFVEDNWNMIDENGDISDTFPPHSTLESEDEPEQAEIQNNNSQAENIVVKPLENTTETQTESTIESNSEGKGNNTLIYVTIGIVVIAVAMIIFYLFKNRK